MEKKRDNTIDIAKGIAIILMCMGHSYCPKVVYDFVYLFHMSFFFMMSGWFFRWGTLNHPVTFLRKRITGLWLPFVTFGALFVLFHNVLLHMGMLQEGNTYYTIKEMAWKIFTTQTRFIPTEDWQLSYWFLSSLFFCNIYSFILFFLSSRTRHKEWVAIALFTISYVTGFVLLHLGMKTGVTMFVTSSLYYIGHFLHSLYPKISKYHVLLALMGGGDSNFLYRSLRDSYWCLPLWESMGVSCSVLFWMFSALRSCEYYAP